MTEILASFVRITSWSFASFENGRSESRSSSVRPPSGRSAEVAARVGPFRGADFPFQLPLEIPLVFQSFIRPEGLLVDSLRRLMCCGLLLFTWLVRCRHCLSTHVLSVLSSAGRFKFCRSCLSLVFSASTASLVSPLAGFFVFLLFLVSCERKLQWLYTHRLRPKPIIFFSILRFILTRGREHQRFILVHLEGCQSIILGEGAEGDFIDISSIL